MAKITLLEGDEGDEKIYAEEVGDKKIEAKEVAVAAEDHLSNLPSEVLAKILSYMPLQDAAKAIVLSKQWLDKWPSIPAILVFKEASIDQNILEGVIAHLLIRHKRPIVKLDLSGVFFGVSTKIPSPVVFDKWIGYLAAKKVQIFIFNIPAMPTFHSDRLFDCLSLRRLELHFWLFQHLPTNFRPFEVMVILHLYHATFSSEHLFESLIRGCVVLEDLLLESFTGLSVINIPAPRLKIVRIVGNFQTIDFERNPKLSTVFISLSSDFDLKQRDLRVFLPFQTQLQKLTIHGFFLKFLVAKGIPSLLPHFILLRKLSMMVRFESSNEVRAIFCLLESGCGPNLQDIEIVVADDDLEHLRPTYFCWKDNMCFNIRNVTIYEVVGTAVELEWLRLILKCSPFLETLSIYVRDYPDDEYNKDLALRVLTAVTRFNRSSEAAQVIYKYPSSSS